MEQYPCLHSRMESDCVECWKGYVSRQNAHIERLRQMLVDAGAGQALSRHDSHWFGGNARPLPQRSGPCDVCNGTGLTYDQTECRMVPCGGICCVVES